MICQNTDLETQNDIKYHFLDFAFLSKFSSYYGIIWKMRHSSKNQSVFSATKYITLSIFRFGILLPDPRKTLTSMIISLYRHIQTLVTFHYSTLVTIPHWLHFNSIGGYIHAEGCMVLHIFLLYSLAFTFTMCYFIICTFNLRTLWAYRISQFRMNINHVSYKR